MLVARLVVFGATLLLAASCGPQDVIAADENSISTPESTLTTLAEIDDSTASTSSPLEFPPPLLTLTPDEAVEAAPLGFCWIGECGDYIEQEPPIITTAEPINLTFAVSGWDFEVVAAQGCVPGTFDLEKVEEQAWELTWTGPPGLRVFEARGNGPEGSASFTFAVDATVGFGPDVPRGGFQGFYSTAKTPPSPELSLRLSSSDPELVAPKSITLTITGTDGRTTEVEIIDSQSDGPCISNYQVNGFATIDIIEEIGLGEWGYRFVIETNDGRWFEAEFGPGSTLERTYDSPRVLTFGPIDPPPDS